jgi:hypothetical protein
VTDSPLLKKESGTFMPGGARPGAGRPKGSKNRLSPERKAFLRGFIDGTQEQAVNDWKSIKEPADRFRLWLSAAEYCYPKLGRHEHTGEAGGPIEYVIRDLGKERSGG